MRIYVAGPMRGIPQFNFPAFDTAAEALRGMGHEVFNPAERDRDVHGQDFADANHTGDEDSAAQTHGFDLRLALSDDATWICQNADAIVVLPGWEGSKGANAEVALGRALGLFILRMDVSGPEVWLVDVDSEPEATPSPSTSEVRSVSTTGGEKGVKPARYDLIPAGPLEQLARLYGRGAAKYEPRNWERGYEWSKSFAAMQRHAWQFWGGQDDDEETGLPHLASVAWHALALLQFREQHPAYDDRPAS